VDGLWYKGTSNHRSTINFKEQKTYKCIYTLNKEILSLACFIIISICVEFTNRIHFYHNYHSVSLIKFCLPPPCICIYKQKWRNIRICTSGFHILIPKQKGDGCTLLMYYILPVFATVIRAFLHSVLFLITMHLHRSN
jgi:hypothetical protein